MIETNKIYAESCLDTMARMPNDYLDCVITSPPYYGLRSYKGEPQVWGGDIACQHIWGAELPNPKADTRPIELKISQGATVGSNVASQHWAQGTMGAFCQQCSAWRGELGLEPKFQMYIANMLEIFREVKRVLKPTGSVWVNLGDSYSGSGKGPEGNINNGSTFRHLEFVTRPNKELRAKSLMNIPARFAIGMTDELQFIQRNELVWHKPSCMPSSAKDRFTVDFEPIFFFTKEPKYYFEQQIETFRTSQKEIDRQYVYGEKDTEFATSKAYSGGVGYGAEGRNMRTTWTVPFEPSGNEHYASYPTRLVTVPIRAGSPEGGIVYDPFFGTGTSGVVAHKLGRKWIGSELNPDYVAIAERRLEPYLAQASLFTIGD